MDTDRALDEAELEVLGDRLEALLFVYCTASAAWSPQRRAGHDDTAISARVHEVETQALHLAEAIVEVPASSLAGLRAKALAMLFEARPVLLDHSGELNFPDAEDGGGGAVAVLRGLRGDGPHPGGREDRGRAGGGQAGTSRLSRRVGTDCKSR